ncbi:MAG: HD domain-containing protein [Cyanobium sp. M30B3]|jgi:hypothetical protein|nr:MAG: HD domain-containing protein [Cyanobium sp. M30B3]
MRDFFIYPAQTNLELYAQAISHGYSSDQCRALADAYVFALRQVFSLARGSGKPFIAHLVGTASLVMESGCPDHWVIGALLHAVYQHRVPFEAGLEPEERRVVLADRFGTQVDDLVHRYTSFESADLGAYSGTAALAEADVLTLRLADELEDLCGNALALHGNAGADDIGLRGGYPWRRDAKTTEAPTLLELTRRLSLDGMHRGFSQWLVFESTPAALADMRTGWFSSVSLVIA